MAIEVDGPLHVAYNIPCFQNMGFIGVQFAHSVADVLKQILRAVSMYGNAQISERYVPTTDRSTATPKKGPWKLLHLCYQNILFMKSKHKNKHF